MDSRIGNLAERGKLVNASWLLISGLLIALLLSGPALAEEASLRDVTPSTILAPGQWEGKMFTSFYTQTKFFDENGERQDAGARSTYATIVGSILRGVTARWNAGLDLTVRGVRDESFPQEDRERWALASLAPKVKWAPFPSQPTLSVQGSLSVPVASGQAGDTTEPFLDFGDLVAAAQLFYDWRHSASWLTYLEQGAFVRFAEVDEGETAGADDAFTTATKAIVNFYPTDAWTLYAAQELLFDWKKDDGPDWYFQTGLGAKRLLGDSFEAEILGTIFPAGRNKGAGSTMGIGLRALW